MTGTTNVDGQAPDPASRPLAGLRWRWVAIPAVLLVVAVAAVFGSRPTPPVTPEREVQPLPAVVVAPPVVETAPAPEEPPPVVGSEPVATPSTSAVVPAATAARPVVRPPAPVVSRVRIPALSVDAPIAPMGFDASGVMEVPQNPTTVAWYGFSATPGNAGNAVMAAHVTWGGARAVFNQLHALRVGDVIDVRTPEGDIRYAVQRTYMVRPEDADVAGIVGPREGPQTLTLITCGGSFDSSVREYDHRVIVFATRI